MQRVLRVSEFPFSSLFRRRVIFNGSSFVPAKAAFLRIYWIVPRCSRLSSSSFHDSAQSYASRACFAARDVVGFVAVSGYVV